MIQVRKAAERGHFDHGWLDTWHSFSFGEYFDEAHMGFSALRVINDDFIAPGGGFGMHPHRDMEIVTYLMEGALRHQDSMGNGSVIRAGDVQRMSAGTGVRHSEFNASASERVHLLQIWLLPKGTGLAPEYEQKTFSAEEKTGHWQVLASPDGRDGSLTIHQDAILMATLLRDGQRLEYRPAAGRRLYLQMANGAAVMNGTLLSPGDGAYIENEIVLTLSDAVDAEALLFDLP